MSVRYTKLEVPSFDLKWIQWRNRYFMFIPGGGGSAQSGLKNVIQVYETLLNGEVILLAKLELSETHRSKLCHNLSVCNDIFEQVPFCISFLDLRE